MRKTINFYNIPNLDKNNQMDFSSLNSQKSFFNSLNIRSFQGNYCIDGEQETYQVKCNLEEIKMFDYISINEQNKTYYYFIIYKKYEGSEITRIGLKLDVFQTYLFDFEMMDSYVERTHVDRWKKDGSPTDEFIDEGLEFGENIVLDNKMLFQNLLGGMIIVSNIPIGKIDGRKQVQNGGIL